MVSKIEPILIERIEEAFDRAWSDGVVSWHRRVSWEAREIRFGMPGLDRAIGGPLPRPGFIELFGPPSTGKSALCLELAARVQEAGSGVVWIDAEKTFLKERALKAGLDLERLTVIRALEGEDAIAAASLLLRSGRFGLLVIDSLAALLPRSEYEGRGTGFEHQRLISKLVKQVARENTNAIVVGINQVRFKPIGKDGKAVLLMTPGSRDFIGVSALRIETRKLGPIYVRGHVIGEHFGFTIVKNLFYPPFRKARASYLFSRGFDSPRDAVLEAESCGIIQYGIEIPSRFSFVDRRQAYKLLRERKDLLDQLIGRLSDESRDGRNDGNEEDQEHGEGEERQVGG